MNFTSAWPIAVYGLLVKVRLCALKMAPSSIEQLRKKASQVKDKYVVQFRDAWINLNTPTWFILFGLLSEILFFVN